MAMASSVRVPHPTALHGTRHSGLRCDTRHGAWRGQHLTRETAGVGPP